MSDDPKRPADEIELDDGHPIVLPPPKRTPLQRLSLTLQRVRGLREQIEQARSRSRALDVTLDVVERDSDIGGGILAGALAYRIFVFALPLGVFLVSALGVVADLVGSEPEDVGDSVGYAGLVTDQVSAAASTSANLWVALGALPVLAYVTRVLLRAVAIVHALAWERTAAHVRVTARMFGIFSAAVAGQLALVAAFGTVRGDLSAGLLAGIPPFALGIAAVWLVISIQLPHAGASRADLLPGALLYAAGILAVQLVGIYVIERIVQSKAGTYGTLGIAAAVLLGFYFMGRIVVAAAVLNATLHARRSASRSPG
ncbi:MAG TPA: hypothetical protein VK915_02765 [Gaiellaceae bacterium]|nr:hypothetical protein [Gaiellaceae bacterium]